MFKKLFGKKNSGKELNDLSEAINNSTLKMLNHQLFMHYYDENATPEPQNPAWQNQGIFFWAAKESFEQKSLPPDFKELEEKYFIVNKIPSSIFVSKVTVVPWFGMPGGGDKYFFTDGDAQLPISKLISSKSLSYVQIIDLEKEDLNILRDRENYYLLLDSESVRFEPTTDKFFFREKETSLGGAYSLGGVKVIKLN